LFSVLLDPAALGDRAAFEAEAMEFLRWVQASPPREGFEGPVQVAGDAERASKARRSVDGVPVDSTTWSEILVAADKLGVGAARVGEAAGMA
jgi:hydroxycarboxylate dehydrogenase B